MVLNKLRKVRLHCNAPKCGFGVHKIEYLGYTLSRDSIAPQPKKVSATLAITQPKSCQEVGKISLYGTILL